MFRELGTQTPPVSRVQPAETRLRPGTTLRRRAREKRLRRPLQSIQGSSLVEHQTGFKPPTSSFPTAGRLPCTRQLSGRRPQPCRSEPPRVPRHRTLSRLWPSRGWREGHSAHGGAPNWARASPGQLGGPQSRVRPPDAPGQATMALLRERTPRPRRGARGPGRGPKGHGGRPSVCLAVSWAPFPGTLLPPGHWSHSPVESGGNGS